MVAGFGVDQHFHLLQMGLGPIYYLDERSFVIHFNQFWLQFAGGIIGEALLKSGFIILL